MDTFSDSSRSLFSAVSPCAREDSNKRNGRGGANPEVRAATWPSDQSPRNPDFVRLPVGEGGLEPPHPFEYWHLKPARLPFRHSPEWSHHASNSPTERPTRSTAHARRDAAHDERGVAPSSKYPGETMGLQSFERGLERMVEGVFSRRSRSSIRPVELGRRLLREMDDHRSVDVKGRRIVPNAFTFHLSPQRSRRLRRHRRGAARRAVRGRPRVRPRRGLPLRRARCTVDTDRRRRTCKPGRFGIVVAAARDRRRRRRRHARAAVGRAGPARRPRRHHRPPARLHDRRSTTPTSAAVTPRSVRGQRVSSSSTSAPPTAPR